MYRPNVAMLALSAMEQRVCNLADSHSKVVLVDNVLHLLHELEVSEAIAHRDDTVVTSLENVADLFSLADRL